VNPAEPVQDIACIWETHQKPCDLDFWLMTLIPIRFYMLSK